MQEILPFVVHGRPIFYPEVKAVGKALRLVIIAIWKPIRWLLEAMFTTSPQQEYIEQNRVKAMRLIGHF